MDEDRADGACGKVHVTSTSTRAQTHAAVLHAGRGKDCGLGVSVETVLWHSTQVKSSKRKAECAVESLFGTPEVPLSVLKGGGNVCGFCAESLQARQRGAGWLPRSRGGDSGRPAGALGSKGITADRRPCHAPHGGTHPDSLI